MPIKTNRQWMEEYHSQPDVDFMRFIAEVQADATLDCAETIEQVSHCWEPAQILRGKAASLLNPPDTHE